MKNLLSKATLGWACLFIAATTLFFFGYAIFMIMPLITTPPSILDNPKFMGEDKRLAAYVLSLEYESFGLRLHGTQIAIGFVLGLLFSTFGMLLLSAGIMGDIAVDGQQNEAKVSVRGLTPGLVILVCGAALIGVAESKKMTRSFDASYLGRQIQTSTDLPKGGLGNEPRSDD